MSGHRVLFVCVHNSGRSQMAEAFYNHHAGGKKSISAAGIHDVSARLKSRVPSDVVTVMKEKGIAMSNHRVEFVTKEMVDNSKKVVAFCYPKRCPEFLRDASKVKFIPLRDPHLDESSRESELARIRVTRDKIEKIVLGLLKDR